MAGNKNIQNGRVPDEDLLKYLSMHASSEETMRLDEQMQEDPFLADAVEGLQKYASVNKLQKDLHVVNTKLKQQTGARPDRKRKKIGNLNLALYLIFLLIIIVLVAFIILQGFK